MIERAKEAAAATGIDVEGRLAVQPFDGLDRARHYGTVFSIGSFAIGGSADRDAAALRRIHDHLVPGGAVILSYEVASDEDHARMADPARPYPRPWAESGTRAILTDGDELELRTRAAGYDAGTRTHHMEIRALLWRGGTLVREEAGSLLNTYYRPEDVARMLDAAGFVDIVAEGPYTGRPLDAADDTAVMVARRVS